MTSAPNKPFSGGPPRVGRSWKETEMNRCTWYTAVLTLAVPLVYTLLGSVRAESHRQAIQATKVIDLTHMMHENMPFWPGGANLANVSGTYVGSSLNLSEFVAV
jgi:hypothetical protein